MWWESILQTVSSVEFWKYASIPFVSAIVGWATNVLALKMTFYPIHFVGVWKIGWQGIIPSRAGVMAGKAVELLTKKLITMEERFSQLEPERVAEELEPALNRLAVQIIDETMEEEAPVIWESAPAILKKRIFQKASEDIPEVVEDLMLEVKNNIDDLFDLRKMVVEALEEDPDLLNQIFLKVGSAEFKFIERSGLYFGFLFGLIQMGIFTLVSLFTSFDAGWILPVAGLFVGWATNVLALRMIFKPLRPKKYGPWRVQGLFIKRQMEVASEYAHIVTERILTSANIMEELVTGPAADRLMQIVRVHVKKAVDSSAGLSKPLIQLTAGTKTYIRIKNIVSKRFIAELPHSIKHLFAYAEEALDIENTLRTRMQGLSPPEFVGFLHPIFEEDEWKLILVGAVLGFLAGLAQMVLVFGAST